MSAGQVLVVGRGSQGLLVAIWPPLMKRLGGREAETTRLTSTFASVVVAKFVGSSEAAAMAALSCFTDRNKE